MTDIRRRVLFVTSSYAPFMTADVHRARQLAWELPGIGWDVELLHPSKEFQKAEYADAAAARLFNAEIRCHEAKPRATRLFRLLTMNSIGWRALWPLHRAGAALLRRKRFDLIYITTGNAILFCLAFCWRRTFETPCVLDFHDPWVVDESRYQTTKHTWKLWVNKRLARTMERWALQAAEGVVSVSPAYIEQLRRRYPGVRSLQDERCAVIPFAGCERDFVGAAESTFSDGDHREIVYVGAGGPIMAKSFAAICAALATLRQGEEHLVRSLRIRILGTYGYVKTKGTRPLQDIAARFGLADIVEELPARVTYVKTMDLIKSSDGLLVLGVDDAGYMPSKLFTYAASGKPLLASLHPKSPALALFKQLSGMGHAICYDDEARPNVDAVATMKKFLSEVRERETFERRVLLAEYLSPSMAKRHAALFSRIAGGGVGA
jgi:hypothetical protein